MGKDLSEEMVDELLGGLDPVILTCLLGNPDLFRRHLEMRTEMEERRRLTELRERETKRRISIATRTFGMAMVTAAFVFGPVPLVPAWIAALVGLLD